MSEGTEVVQEQAQDQAQEEDKASSKRKTLSLGERIQVVDYLRSLAEPIVADSNVEIANIVSTGSGVEIGWQQLKYMIDDPTMAKWKLGDKVHVKSLLTSDDWKAVCATLATQLDSLSTIVLKLVDRIDVLEEKQ